MSLIDQRRPRSERARRKARRDAVCPCCHAQRALLWSCDCGLEICQECMQRDLWGFTCNNITWVCPDCGALRSY